VHAPRGVGNWQTQSSTTCFARSDLPAFVHPAALIHSGSRFRRQREVYLSGRDVIAQTRGGKVKATSRSLGRVLRPRARTRPPEVRGKRLAVAELSRAHFIGKGRASCNHIVTTPNGGPDSRPPKRCGCTKLGVCRPRRASRHVGVPTHSRHDQAATRSVTRSGYQSISTHQCEFMPR